jgi:predicted molibdopterin-dependent oxidoreductase YjgC
VKAIDGASVLFVLDESLDGVSAETLSGAANVIFMGASLPEVQRSANVVLPGTIQAEEDGCYVNRDGRIQRYRRAKMAPGEARPAWLALGGLLPLLGRGEAVTSAAQALSMAAERVQAFQGLSYERIGEMGVVVQGSKATGGGK